MKIIASKDTIPISELQDLIENLTSSDLDKANASGCPMLTCMQTKGDLLYLPAGWMTVELVTKGVLVYGVRKTFFIRSSEQLASYNALISMYTLAKKNTDKMTVAVGHLEPPCDED